MGLPEITVKFTTLANTAITRSTRGAACVVVIDATKPNTIKRYTSKSAITASDYTATNLADIERMFLAAPSEVVVIAVSSKSDWAKAEAMLNQNAWAWVCSNSSDLQTNIVTYLKNKNDAAKTKRYMGIVNTATAPDSAYIVNVPNTAVTEKGGTSVNIANYLPRLCAILAAMPLDQSATYYELDDLIGVTAVADVDASIDSGNMPIFDDDGIIRIGRGVTSLTTVKSGQSTTMKKIAVVEAMNMIFADIIGTWKSAYCGKRKNTADNQALFIGEVNKYFKKLGQDGVLSPDYDNVCDVDVDAQRAAWEAEGKDTSSWSNAQVKKMTYRANVFIKGNIYILDAMEDMTFSIVMQ